MRSSRGSSHQADVLWQAKAGPSGTRRTPSRPQKSGLLRLAAKVISLGAHLLRDEDFRSKR